MKRALLSFLCLTCFLSYSCKTYDANELPDEQLQFGNGGGFTGMTTEYTLLKNGQIFIRQGRADGGEQKELGQVKAAQAKAIYAAWETNDLLREEISQPGNRYYFICMKKDTMEYRQSWGSSGYTPDTSITAIYDQAMELVKTVMPEDTKQ